MLKFPVYNNQNKCLMYSFRQNQPSFRKPIQECSYKQSSALILNGMKMLCILQYLIYKARLHQQLPLNIEELIAKYKDEIYFCFTASWTTTLGFVQQGYMMHIQTQGLFVE